MLSLLFDIAWTHTRYDLTRLGMAGAAGATGGVRPDAQRLDNIERRLDEIDKALGIHTKLQQIEDKLDKIGKRR